MIRLFFALITAIVIINAGSYVSAFADKARVMKQKSFQMKISKRKAKRFISLLKNRKLRAAKRLLPQLGPLAYKSRGGYSEYNCGFGGCVCVTYADCWRLALEKSCTVRPLPGPAGPFVGTCIPGQ